MWPLEAGAQRPGGTMNAPHESLTNESWAEQNQRWLTHQFALLRQRIDAEEAAPDDIELSEDFEPALERCANLFGLSEFERELLMLAAGVELDNALRQSVMHAHGRTTEGSRLAQPTFSLALAVLHNPHWDALSPQAPLRRWKLVELDGRRTPALQPLYIDERILHFVSGVVSFDARLHGLVRLVPAPHHVESQQLAQRIARGLTSPDGRAPLVVLTQDRPDPETLHTAAQDMLAATDSVGLWLMARDLPTDAAELADIALLLDREASLTGGVPIIELDAHAEAAAEHEHRCVTLLAHLLGPAMLLGSCEPARLARLQDRRVLRINIPGPKEQTLEAHARLAVDESMGDTLARALRPALQQFHLSASALRNVLEQVVAEAPTYDDTPLAEYGDRPSERVGPCLGRPGAAAREDEPQPELDRRVWQACRDATRGGLDALAQRVDSQAGFDDIVLPATQIQLLKEIAEHLRHRCTVYGDWGMGGKALRGQGLCVLFAGESGTGKTLAAEAIANEAMLDLYRIDLATVVSKYIGETEKNLKRVFDAAEASGAVLLFDEADALYGKRSDVKDSHDRYANIEVAYLLQRVEAYRGLAILTTNFRSALDRAFLRRIRFIVQFPFPDEAAREQIWRRELPPSAPIDGVDFTTLARMQLAGGHIRSVALNAAFMAAGAGEAISMNHLRHAAQREAAKLERPLTEASQRAWS